mmetsp:Transcript_62987/g.203083  ORF Transcript_62987/g.203083 Transcript_62987/m.203083 type:complete len:124 (+) Transcript_62987:5-376(+)
MLLTRQAETYGLLVFNPQTEQAVAGFASTNGFEGWETASALSRSAPHRTRVHTLANLPIHITQAGAMGNCPDSRSSRNIILTTLPLQIILPESQSMDPCICTEANFWTMLCKLVVATPQKQIP